MFVEELRKKARRELDKGIRKLLAPKNIRELPPEWPDDFSDFTKTLCSTDGPYSTTSKIRISSIEAATRYICAYEIPGDFVECGVGPGGSVMAMAMTLQKIEKINRDLWLYDTFEGMPEPTEYDIGRFGTPASRTYKQRTKNSSSWIKFSIDSVQANLSTTGYPSDRLHFVKGKVQETLLDQRSDRVALLSLTPIGTSQLSRKWNTSSRLLPAEV